MSTKARHARRGIGALAVYIAIVVITAFVLYEIGSGSLGYSSLANKFFDRRTDHPHAAQRYGKIRVRSDYYGNCQEFSLDNETQQLVEIGTVVCDPEENARFRPRSKSEIFRRAFGGEE